MSVSQFWLQHYPVAHFNIKFFPVSDLTSQSSVTT